MIKNAAWIIAALGIIMGIMAIANEVWGNGINKQLVRKIRIVVIIMVVGLIAINSYYQVDQTEYAIETTFGKVTNDQIGSGPHFKIPLVQKVYKLSKETYSISFGYDLLDGENIENNDAKMITGDENIILADLEVQYRIVDPIAYLFNTTDPKNILFNATSASLRNVIGNSTVDDALTDGRSRIIEDITVDLKELVSQYNIGVNIVNVNLQDVDLPTYEVDAAFKAVTDAREQRLTKINEAEKYRNEKLNRIKGEQDAIISRAEGTKITMVEKAKADVASFNAIYGEYARNKEVTRQRLITDTLNNVLKDKKVYITDGEGTVKYLPIDVINKGGGE